MYHAVSYILVTTSGASGSHTGHRDQTNRAMAADEADYPQHQPFLHGP